ncbi:MAG: single-strand binding protein [Thermoleophilia bacterium]|nr:single-strand binding protein [Thermoleophilia bacterium]
MNMVALVGNLATDPELRETSGGRKVCSFRLAVSRPGNKEADFLTVVTWERQAEVCNEYLKVGRRVSIEGRLHHSVWEAEDKTRRSKVEIVAHRVGLLGGGPRPEESAPVVDADFAPSESAASGDLALA